MNIELKNINYSASRSEVVYAFMAKVYVNGAYVAEARNSGRDMVNTITARSLECSEILKKVELFSAAYFGDPQPQEKRLGAFIYTSRYIDRLMFDHLEHLEDLRINRDINRRMKQGLIYGDKRISYQVIKLKMPLDEFVTAPELHPDLIALLQHKVLSNMTRSQRLLNTNIPEVILIKAGFYKSQYVAPVKPEKKKTTIRRKQSQKI